MDKGLRVGEQNERIQRLSDMNNLRKPYRSLIARYKEFFNKLKSVQNIFIYGHSCDKVDYPYYKKIKKSVSEDVKWHFYPHKENIENDIKRMKLLIKEIGINPNNTKVVF